MVQLKNNKSLNIGGLSQSEGQELPFASQHIEDIFTDEVRIVESFDRTGKSLNNPVIDDKTINSENYIPEIILGFKNMYKWIIENKDEYKNKIKEIFAGCKCRLVLKPTNVYGQLLQTALHPDLLHNKADRFVYLHRLGLFLKPSKDISEQQKIIKSEIDDLMNNDIPYFFSFVNNKVLFDSKNNKIENYYDESIFENICAHIDNMSLEDLGWQLFFINSSYNKEWSDVNDNELLFSPLESEKNSKNDLLNVSEKIANIILSRSVTGTLEGRKNMTFIEKASANEVSLSGARFTKDGFFEGNAGIALYFAVLSKYSSSPKKYEEISLETLRKIVDVLEKGYSNGIYSEIDSAKGLTGILYAVLRISKILNNKNLYNLAYKKLDYLMSLISETSNERVMDDSHNIISVFNAFYNETKVTLIKEKIIDFCYKTFPRKLVEKFFFQPLKKEENRNVDLEQILNGKFDFRKLQFANLGLSKGVARIGWNSLRIYDNSIPDVLHFE